MLWAHPTSAGNPLSLGNFFPSSPLRPVGGLGEVWCLSLGGKLTQ